MGELNFSDQGRAVAELAIRGRRAAFNRAILQGDAAAIAALLARDCVMVTGSDSAVIAGRMAQVKIWRREFSAQNRLIYIRIPQSLDISHGEPLAMEAGRWEGHEGVPDAAGPATAPLVHGTYAAKWREVDGQWVIEAEVFVTL